MHSKHQSLPFDELITRHAPNSGPKSASATREPRRVVLHTDARRHRRPRDATGRNDARDGTGGLVCDAIGRGRRARARVIRSVRENDDTGSKFAQRFVRLIRFD
jgi:hypothetical protein